MRKLLHHLYGRSFTVKTDSNVLNWLWKKKDINGKFARWLLSLQEYDFTLQHIKGTSNVVADALSRSPVGVAEDQDVAPGCAIQPLRYSSAEMAKLQKQDKSLSEAFKNIEQNGDIKRNSFVLHQEVVYRLNEDPGRAECLVVPTIIRRQLMESCHGGLVSGHLGKEKTLDKLRQRFWWTSMELTVKDYVKTCSFCQLHKGKTALPEGYLCSITQPKKTLRVGGNPPFGAVKKTVRKCTCDRVD